MVEIYRLTLTHYVVDKDTGKKFRLDEPIFFEKVFDPTFGASPNNLNRMFDEMKLYVLVKMSEVKE